MNEQQETEHMAQKEVTITFKVSEQLADMLGRATFEIDKNKSEIIRACILLSLPTILACPSLANRIQVEDFKHNNK